MDVVLVVIDVLFEGLLHLLVEINVEFAEHLVFHFRVSLQIDSLFLKLVYYQLHD